MAKSKGLTGLDKMRSTLDRMAGNFDKEILRALAQEAEVERTESMRRTPVDTGTLRASHHIRGPWKRGKRFMVTIAVGGASAPYALFVHENLEANHNSGQAKFLESTIKEAAPHMASRVVSRMNMNRAAKG